MTRRNGTGARGPRGRIAATAWALACVFALASGCEDSRDGGSSTGAETGADGVGDIDGPMGEVIATWRDAELEPSEFRRFEEDDEAAVDVDLDAAECHAGRVDELPVVLCAYGDADAAEAAEERGLELVGEATGAALSNDELLLIVADRHEVDPEGRRIHQITKAFRELE